MSPPQYTVNGRPPPGSLKEVRREMEKRDVRQIGLQEGLKGKRLWRFERFMALRLPDEIDPIYTAEWASRFLAHTEYLMGDKESHLALRQISMEEEKLEAEGAFEAPELLEEGV